MKPAPLAFRRVLIANRGEIAVRIIRALRMMRIESVAVYSDADRDSRHRHLADWAVRLPGNQSSDTYLKASALIDAAKASQADAIHPGYGFLSENAAFAAEVAAAGLTFIGPEASAINAMGDKIQAKALMRQAGVPVTPGSRDACETVAQVREAIKAIGLPVILKAAAGGGGRGMQVVRREQEIDDLLARCQREALAYFGNAAVFCEKYIERPRHVEIQVIRDRHGNGVHLFERDCTVQRRHQKLIEEAPSTYITPGLREKLGAWALKAAEAVDYHGAGTVEFICPSPEEAYFMEMNTRIQVEHPVTEMVTGVDLIREQIRVAQGERLSIKQESLSFTGHAIEVRINAEDPFSDFAPTPGRIHHLALPGGAFVRVDTHIYEGYEIPQFYDSMIAKIIVWGSDRRQACDRMQAALSEFQCHGVQTTALFIERVLAHARFIRGDYSTRFIEEEGAALLAGPALDAAASPLEDPGLLAAQAAVLVAEKALRSQAPKGEARESAWATAGLLESGHRIF